MNKGIATLLYEYRNEHNLTLRDLEKKISYRYSHSHLGKTERYETNTTSKKFLKVISEELNISYYYLLVGNNYIVNLDTLQESNNVIYNSDQLQNALNQYQIIATNGYQSFKTNPKEFIGSDGNIEVFLDNLTIETKIDKDRLRNIVLGKTNVSLIEAESICYSLKKPFYQLFAIHSTNYYDKNDLTTAFSVHKFIEQRKNRRISTITDQPTLKTITEDEENYLLSCLKIYRELNLRPHSKVN